MSRNYDIHTSLLPSDERALQKAHEIVGGIIEQGILHGINETDLREARELIGNVLASADDPYADDP